VSKIKFSPVLLTGILITLFFAIALFFRVSLPYDKVFVGDWIKFTSADAYYHMRLVDNLVHNFPHFLSFDPYLIYPGGANVSNIHFFDLLLGGIIWLVGLGSPTQHTIDIVSVYFPAVLGALTVIPVYFIGKELFGRWAGVLSAALIAILPGEFLGRSKLGFTDYHIAETFLTTIAMLFLILAVKAASQRQLSFSHFKSLDWSSIIKPLIYSLLAGVFLGIYIRTWSGALLFVFIIAVYFIVQSVIDHLKHKSTDYLCIVGVITFAVALLISLPISSKPLYLASLIIAMLIPLVLNGVSRLMTHIKLKPVFYPVALIVLALAGWGIFYLVHPSLLSSMLNTFRIFNPTGAQLTTIEMQPLISNIYGNPFAVAWGNYPGLIPYNPDIQKINFDNIISFISTSFFLSLFCLAMLTICLFLKHKWATKICPVFEKSDADKIILIVWSVVILIANLGQRRFGYYFAVNVALLTGYLSWRVLELAGFRELTARAVQTVKGARSRKGKSQKGGFTITVNHIVMTLALVVVVIFMLAPSVLSSIPGADISPTFSVARSAPYAPSDAWVSSLYWLKENSPEPFDDPDYYYKMDVGNSYPESAYGVMAWWDYGYWITRIAHRLPNANPSQNPRAVKNVASFFISQDEKTASEIAGELDTSYVIIDNATAYIDPATISGKFWAIATWAGNRPDEYFDSYLLPQEGQQSGQTVYTPVTLYYPEYYRSLAVRLYNFDGKAVTPESVWVISYEERLDDAGQLHKLLTGAEEYSSYEEAETYINSQEATTLRIVGTNPLLSPVPLEELEHYELLYSSNSTVTLPDARVIPEVKIFQYKE
jgi:oligosaccharyl transferase (archaeosortase A-associated)